MQSIRLHTAVEAHLQVFLMISQPDGKATKQSEPKLATGTLHVPEAPCCSGVPPFLAES